MDSINQAPDIFFPTGSGQAGTLRPKEKESI